MSPLIGSGRGMGAIDNLLDEATINADKLKNLIKNDASTPERSLAGIEYINSLEEAEKNLNYLIELAGYYVEGNPHKILEFKHRIGNAKNT